MKLIERKKYLNTLIDVITLCGCSKNSYYKYKRELKKI